MRLPDRQAGAPRKLLTEQRAPLTHDEVKALIRQAAWYRALKRGFAPGRELEDWVEAEAEVKMKLGLWE